MKFGITRLVLGFSGFIEIDEAEYESVKVARTNLLELLLLEETFDILIENFQEYEAKLLSIVSRDTVFNFIDEISIASLAIATKNEKGQITKKNTIHKEFIKRRQALEKKECDICKS